MQASTDLFDDIQLENAELLWDLKEPECLLDISIDGEQHVPEVNQLPLISKTPRKNDDTCVSSPHLETPQTKKLVLPFETCNESPIDRCVVAASTPFHGQRVSSQSSDSNKLTRLETNQEGAGNTTFNMNKQSIAHVNTTFDVNANESRHVEGTFNKDGDNLTFNITTEQNQTFDMKPLEQNIAINSNQTFDMKPDEKDSGGSDAMELCMQLESSAESSEELKSKRKPLKAIPQAKAATTTKKISRLGAPRMNAAAISRIQAKSPNSKILEGAASTTTRSTSAKSFKKPSSATYTVRARKSLLPPSVNASKTTSRSTHTRSCKTVHEDDSENVKQHGTSGTPTKRKAQESPKKIGRSPKKLGTRTTVSMPRASGIPARSNSAPPSKLPSSTQPTRLGKSSLWKAPSSYSRSSNNIRNKLSGSSGSLLSSTKSNSKPVSNNTGAPSTTTSISQSLETLQSDGNLRPQPKKPKFPHDVKCVTALATLLDYVVNRLDGLSAPQLSIEKSRLQNLVVEKDEMNQKVTIEISNLRAELMNTTQKLEQELREERNSKQEFETQIGNLLSELENERQKRRDEATSYNLEIEELKRKHLADLEEWSEKYQTLQQHMETQIQDELEERIKPYINSVAEVKSLTAVLDMKNDNIHQLQAQCSSYSVGRDEVDRLNHKCEQMKQKNEDLTMQLRYRLDETRNLSEECNKLRQSFSEEQCHSAKLRQNNEELKYRLDSVSPSTPSFNPVFTTSPTTEEENRFDMTPRNCGSKRTTTNHSSGTVNDKWPRSLSYESGRDATQTENAL